MSRLVLVVLVVVVEVAAVVVCQFACASSERNLLVIVSFPGYRWASLDLKRKTMSQYQQQWKMGGQVPGARANSQTRPYTRRCCCSLLWP